MRFVRERAKQDDGPDCVLWPFGLRDGYGRVDTKDRNCLAHRLVLELSGNPQPSPDLEVRHLCGIRRCLNRRHLVWGTHAENQQDRFRRHGDTMRGERNPRSKLTARDVATIRGRLSAGERVTDLAKEYGVSTGNISMIRTHTTWAD